MSTAPARLAPLTLLTALSLAPALAMPGDAQVFEVAITNVSTPAPVLESGVFSVPDGATDPGPVEPGGSYTFVVHASPAQHLSLVSMYVQSNDLLVVTPEGGIPLHDADGLPRSGDLSEALSLVDAGTEIDQPLGTGPDQAPRQAGPDTGADDPDPTVRPFARDLSGELSLRVDHLGGNAFEVTLANVATAPVGGAPVVISPGAFASHDPAISPYTLGSVDDGTLEPLAEDGDPTALATLLDDLTGLGTPIAPGVGVVHRHRVQGFAVGRSVGLGMEALAEDGDILPLIDRLRDARLVQDWAPFGIPVGSTEPAPAMPGDTYTFTVTARPGERLSFATMAVQSNDWFFGSPTGGLDLFPGGVPLDGDVTADLVTWDAGTEVDQFPGAGPDQAPRQAGPNQGADEAGALRLVVDPLLGAPAEHVRVTVTPR